ncbi:MAG: Ig-like domain-containing protein, partial [Deltaproteobacteria bacterium]|nr:Ig-like domain-containing protein [Deltaproteobacteria bacterium]
CLVAVLALGLITIIGSNGGDGGTTTTTPDTTPPTVSSTTPADNTTDVAVDTAITTIFSEEMDSSTITTDTFTVNNGSSNIAGTVAYSDKTATFTPTNDLENNTAYTATITTGAKDLWKRIRGQLYLVIHHRRTDYLYKCRNRSQNELERGNSIQPFTCLSYCFNPGWQWKSSYFM